MAITITWSTRVINIPKADLTLKQTTPIEIRELNINDFRLTLKALEDNEDGIAYPNTHVHNTEVLLGGIVYARVIEIINGYTMTFEDGQYAVNLIGANSNLGDVVNLNQVSIRSANAAGLISNQAIEFSSYNGGVTLDFINGTNGTVFPRGTPQLPVNNVPDAVLIAELRGFNTIYVRGDYTFDTGDNLEGFIIIGQSAEKTFLTFNTGALISEINLFNATITGVFDNAANFNDSHIIDVEAVEGAFERCILEGIVTLGTLSGATSFIDCNDGLVLDGNKPTIDFNGGGNSLAIRNYSGDIHLRNKSGLENVEINIATGGHITLENTITGGNIRITGIAEVTDNSTGTTLVDVTHVIFPDQLQLAAFNGHITLNTNSSESGTKFPLGTIQHPVNNIVDALTILNTRGLHEILFEGTLSLTDIDVSDITLIGENNLNSFVLFVSGNTTNRTTIKNTIVSGEFGGYLFIDGCALQNISNVGSTVFPTIFRDCIVRGDVGVTPAIQLNNIVGGQNIHLINCVSGVPGQGTVTLDVNNSDIPIAFRKYGGGVKLINITGAQDNTFEFDQGQIVIDSSCTSGKVRLGGIYKLTDNGTLTIEERNKSISDAVWDENVISGHTTTDSAGKVLSDITSKSDDIQHSVNVNSELLKLKPNNP
jgi:hypothetical protein